MISYDCLTRAVLGGGGLATAAAEESEGADPLGERVVGGAVGDRQLRRAGDGVRGGAVAVVQSRIVERQG